MQGGRAERCPPDGGWLGLQAWRLGNLEGQWQEGETQRLLRDWVAACGSEDGGSCSVSRALEAGNDKLG